VVRTSVFGRRTFPALCPIYGLQVTTLWANCPLWVSQPRQLSLSSLRDWETGSNYMDYGDGDN